MSIFVNKCTNIIVQGITGTQGTIHSRLMAEYGSNIVAGTSPGKGGKKVGNIPVYDLVEEATKHHKVDASIIFVPPASTASAAIEAIENEISLVVIITEHVPVYDSVDIVALAQQHGTTVIGPNTPGVISPGKSKLGIMPASLYSQGVVGLISRSGTLTHEIAATLTGNGIGQSTCLGIGGDPVVGTGFISALKAFEKDEQTEKIILIGEIGGTGEEEAADYIKENITKEVIAFIAGRFAPTEKKMGHAGAIILRDKGSAQSKIKAFNQAGVRVVTRPKEIPTLIRN